MSRIWRLPVGELPGARTCRRGSGPRRSASCRRRRRRSGSGRPSRPPRRGWPDPSAAARGVLVRRVVEPEAEQPRDDLGAEAATAPSGRRPARRRRTRWRRFGEAERLTRLRVELRHRDDCGGIGDLRRLRDGGGGRGGRRRRGRRARRGRVRSRRRAGIAVGTGCVGSVGTESPTPLVGGFGSGTIGSGGVRTTWSPATRFASACAVSGLVRPEGGGVRGAHQPVRRDGGDLRRGPVRRHRAGRGGQRGGRPAGTQQRATRCGCRQRRRPTSQAVIDAELRAARAISLSVSWSETRASSRSRAHEPSARRSLPPHADEHPSEARPSRSAAGPACAVRAGSRGRGCEPPLSAGQTACETTPSRSRPSRAGRKSARRAARVVEPGHPGQDDRDEQRPPGDAVAPRAGGREAAEARRDRLRPRLQLAEVARRDHDAALDRRLAQAGDQHLAHDDRATIHAGATPWPTSITSVAEHEHLVGDRVEQRAERRGAPVPAREPPVEEVGRSSRRRRPRSPSSRGSGSSRRRARRRPAPTAARATVS